MNKASGLKRLSTFLKRWERKQVLPVDIGSLDDSVWQGFSTWVWTLEQCEYLLFKHEISKFVPRFQIAFGNWVLTAFDHVDSKANARVADWFESALRRVVYASAKELALQQEVAELVLRIKQYTSHRPESINAIVPVLDEIAESDDVTFVLLRLRIAEQFYNNINQKNVARSRIKDLPVQCWSALVDRRRILHTVCNLDFRESGEDCKRELFEIVEQLGI